MPKERSQKKYSSNSSKGSSSSSSAPAGGSHSVRTLLTPNTSIGQHFLKNPAIVDAIVDKAGK